MCRVAVCLVWTVAAAAPTITKVEPPNWRLTNTYNTVQLLLRGTDLQDVQVKAERGLEIVTFHANETGHYLFVDVKPHRAGTYTLKISSKQGSAEASVEVFAPLASKGRYQGLSDDDLICQIPEDRFPGGGLAGVAERLGYLKEFGFTAIWLTAPYGDQPTDFYASDGHFGDVGKLREFVDKAHEAGIKVILDLVMNHTAPAHPWATDPPLRDWLHGTAERHLNASSQIWALLDPHAGRTMRDPVLDGWIGGRLPDLNQDEPEAARYLIQNALWWIASTGVDGVGGVGTPFVPRTFWRDWNDAISKEFKNLTTVGEAEDAAPAVVSFFEGGARRFDGIDAGMGTMLDYPSYGAIRRCFVEGKPMTEVAYVIAHDSLYARPGDLVTFAERRGTPRFLAEPGATAEGLKLAVTFLLTTRGVPSLEFEDGSGDTSETKDSKNVLRFASGLAKLRRETPDLRTGKLVQMGAGRDVYVYQRGELIVLLNNGTKPATVDIPAANGTWKDLLDVEYNIAVRANDLKVTVPARAGRIMKQW